MIGSLLYLTATRPDIHFAVCLCAHFQASPHTSHIQVVILIMRYLNFTTEFVSHPVLEGKPNVNHVRARISNSRTQ
jgi:hypothetical protein